MKLCVSTYSLWRWRSDFGKTLEDTIDFVADNGAAAIEFSGLDDKAKDNPLKRAAELRNYATKRGLAVPSYCVGAELLVPADKQKETIAQVKRDIDIAAELGAKSMRHDVTRGWGDHSKGVPGKQNFNTALAYIVPAVREITEYGATKGVKTTLENHGFYMQASTRVEQLINMVDHPNYGLTIDMGNFLCANENPIDAVTTMVKYAFMAHVKDFHIKPKEQAPNVGWIHTPTSVAIRGAIVGHGNIDIPRQLRILKEAGYNWYLSLEFEGLEESSFGVKTGLEWLREQLKAIDALG